MSRPVRSRIVRPYSWGSDTRFLRDRQWHPFTYYTARGVAGLFRRWRVTVPAFGFLWLWGSAGWLTAVLVGVLLTAGLTAWLGWRRAEGSAMGKPSVEELRQRATLRKQWPLACRSAKL